MKKIVYIFLFVATVAFSQEFQGKATYQTHRNVDIKVSSDKNAPNKAIQKQLHEQLKKLYQKTYTLQFNRTTSTYKQNAKLETAQPKSNGVTISIVGNGGGSDVLYKNLSNTTYTNKREVSGKRFLIQDSLPNYNWKLTSETKKIGKYTCYKATKTKEVENNSFTMTDGKEEETVKMVTVTTVAWYTPEIPVSTGPDMYGGLPGLILEIQEGKKTIVCTEIVLHPKESIHIKKPKKGKKVSQKQFDKIMDEKTKEMLERFKSRKSPKGSKKGISIKISN